MSRVVLNCTMSLDGFMAGPDIGVEHPMGRGGLRLHEWIFNASTNDVDTAVAREVSASTGAVVLGRRTFDVGVGVWQDTPFPVPCFVLTHTPRSRLAMKSGSFTFLTGDVSSALREAQAAADGKDVTLMGADIARQALRAGLLDEINLQIAPVLMGEGRRLFDQLGTEHIELERTRLLASPHVTHLRFRVTHARDAPSDSAPAQGLDG
ncbi:dihydrofolate reductase family protein [Streptomyces sp. NPDC005017]|uniref:dihydrofolate reductase family protein n=1 Tax=Streptomyces sp. NPDC005017 TaxID=3364706 RepID=UPI0036CF7ED1